MKPYEVFLWLGAVETLRVASSLQRQKMSKFIDSLVEYPLMLGNYTETDDTDREIQIKVIGKFAIAYWVDHAVAEIKVVEIWRADRP